MHGRTGSQAVICDYLDDTMAGTHQQFRLADLLAALSVTTDLAMGQPPEKAIRSCLVATAANASSSSRR